MWKTEPIQIQVVSYTHKYRKNIFQKVGLLEKTKEGGKEEKDNRVNNNEAHHICVGARHKKIH
jgi:hypothetical protein